MVLPSERHIKSYNVSTGYLLSEKYELEVSFHIVRMLKVVLFIKKSFPFCLQILKACSLIKHLIGKILSFEFYPKDLYFECKFWISRSAITHVQN